MEVHVNYLAVLLAAVASMAIGSAWYAHGIFGNTWIKLAKMDEKKMKIGAPRALITAFVLSLLLAYVLAHLAYLSNQFFHDSFFAGLAVNGALGMAGHRVHSSSYSRYI